MRVFVAGANGAVGRRLVPMVVARGHQVTGTTTSEIEIVGGRVATIRSVVNPDKLGHIGPVESLREVMDAMRSERPVGKG